MGQRRNAKSVRNFVVFLLILQNCGQARSQPEIELQLEQEQESRLQQRRDGLAKFEFSGKQLEQDEGRLSGSVVPAAPPNVFNFAKICETFYAQFMRTAVDADADAQRGRGLRNPQAQLMWETQSSPADEEVVLVTSPKPFHVVEQLHQNLEEQRKRKPMSTVKPFNVLQQLAMVQAEQLRQKRPNGSFNILEALQMEQDKWEQQTSTVKPFHVVQQLQQELEELQKHTTTVKPFSVLEHLALHQAEELRRKKTPNSSFSLLEALHMEQEKLEQQRTTVKPFHLAAQLNQELEKHEEGEVQGQGEEEEEEAFEVLQSVAEPLEEHKAVPAESTRAKDSQKRKRKRIRRRRKRIQKRRKRKRRRNRKQRKKRKKRKKKKGDKDKKKKKKRKKKRRKKPMEETGIIGQQAHLIFANPTKQPYHSHNYPYPHPHPQPHPQQPQIIQIVTTKRPTTTPAPFSKIKYLLRHNTLFKKKKKEWFNHVGHVLYPFVKFVAFFTVLNPFTLGVFLFTLISPAVFGFLGFVALSVLVKPFLHLVFGVKDTVGAIDRRRYLANKQAEQLKLNLRPVSIHKHYYQQKPLHSTPPHRYRPLADWRRQTAEPAERRHNPLLPADRTALAHL